MAEVNDVFDKITDEKSYFDPSKSKKLDVKEWTPIREGEYLGHIEHVETKIVDVKKDGNFRARLYRYTVKVAPENKEQTYKTLGINGEIEEYWIWIETDPVTEEGYWIYYYEGINYYWENPDGQYVAGSDEEFYQYHYPHVVHMYNEDNKIEEWQGEAAIVVGIDVLLGNENYYSHIWINAFPETVGLTDKAYTGNDMQYDLGALIGAKLSNHVGVFLEGSYLNYYGKNEYTLETGINYKF